MTEPHLEIGAAFPDTPGSLAIFPSWGLYIEGSATQCLKEQAQNISCSLPFESYKIVGVAGAGRQQAAQSAVAKVYCARGGVWNVEYTGRSYPSSESEH